MHDHFAKQQVGSLWSRLVVLQGSLCGVAFRQMVQLAARIGNAHTNRSFVLLQRLRSYEVGIRYGYRGAYE